MRVGDVGRERDSRADPTVSHVPSRATPFLRACRPLDRADERPLKTLAHSPAARPASPPRSTSWARSSTPLPASHNSAFQTRRQPKCFGSVSLQDSSTDPADRLLVRQAERASSVSSGCPSQASESRLGRLPEPNYQSPLTGLRRRLRSSSRRSPSHTPGR
jgi:hypothetical protein